MATAFKIREIWSPDLETDSVPSDPSSFQGLFKFRLESNRGNEREVFKFLVFTTLELAKVRGPLWGTGMLILEEFSWTVLEPQLEHRLSHIVDNDWQKIVWGVMRHFQLEDEFWDVRNDA